VTLTTHSADHAQELAARRENTRYLPGVAIPENVVIADNADEAATGVAAIFVVVPSSQVADVAKRLAGRVDDRTVVVCCAKGFDPETGRQLSTVLAEHGRLPVDNVGALSGPNLAREIAAGQPASSVVACGSLAAAERIQALLHSTALRVYTSTDVTGVEYGGALKNVVAIGAGVVDGLGLGQNAKAAFMTRGLAEMIRLGVAAGANPLTFGGLSGLGDLIATCESPLSRNRSFGEMLAQGIDAAAALERIPHVVEGVSAARLAVRLGDRYGVATPIASTVTAVLDGTLSIREAMSALMTRGTRPELDD
jgi:glycerol-3-phosphate dehydrogenase (NAD(P)+)